MMYWNSSKDLQKPDIMSTTDKPVRCSRCRFVHLESARRWGNAESARGLRFSRCPKCSGLTWMSMPPFVWALVETPGNPKWLGGSGVYGANVFIHPDPERTDCDWTVWKKRPRHKEGDKELKRGTARNAAAAKKAVEEYVQSLM